MVEQYTEQFYVPGSERSARLQVGGGVRARDLAGAIERLLGAWDAVRVVDLDWTLAPERQLTASISVERGSLGPADIRVDAWIAPGGRDAEAFAARALPAGERDGIAVYRATVQLPAGEEIPTLAARILPRSSGLSDGAVPGLIRWSS
jgi:hypothetical protein